MKLYDSKIRPEIRAKQNKTRNLFSHLMLVCESITEGRKLIIEGRIEEGMDIIAEAHTLVDRLMDHTNGIDINTNK